MSGLGTYGAARLRATLLERPDRILLLDPAGRERTGGELVERIDRLAGTLADEGLAGKRVGVWYANSLAAFEAYLAVEWIGATRIVLDPATARAEAAAILAAGEAVLTLADGAHADMLDSTVICHRDDDRCTGRRRQPAEEVPAARALHLYPRGVRAGELHSVAISYANWAATIELNCRLYRSGVYGEEWDGREVFLTLQQLLHGTSLIGSFPYLSMGLPQVVVPEFDPGAVGELLERFAVTATGMTSGMLAALVRELGDAQIAEGSLRRLLYGGAPLSREQIAGATSALGAVLVQVYGRLEGGWPLSVLGQRDHARILAGEDALADSCGRPVGAPVALALRPVPGEAGDRGELCTRSAMVVDEYADPGGWCALGDLASIDADGYVRLHGRLDNMINTGYHVYPEQVEDALLSIPRVVAAKVCGEPDPQRGEVIVAYVIEDPVEGTGDADALRDDLRALLAAYKLPRRVQFVARLP